ncbi:MAG TPA: septum formation protein Maf, partial [Ruminococcaceae bacterium]|nr:septum formation protein Maf [Oscillospiraceae bacterium]
MIILASASPRRQELLSLITENFKVEPASIDESIHERIDLHKIPEYLAAKKAEYVHGLHPDDTVIGCDTGVFVDNQMIGKPKSDKAAFEILKLLSGKTHLVITGCAVYKGSRVVRFSQVTEVEFYRLTNEEILEYIATGEPSDKAGAYGIQGKGSLFVKRINGDYFNVVGLPVA